MRKVFFLTLFLVSTLAVAAPGTKLAPDTAQAVSATGPLQVIIQWNEATGTDTQKIIQQAGGSVVMEYHNLHAGVYTVPASAIPALDKNSAVAYITLDRMIHHKLAYSAAAINAPAVWKAGWTGAGVGIAVVDSGIDPSADLGMGKNSSIVYSRDFSTFPTIGTSAPDQFGHGQHVAGILASNGTSSRCKACTQTYIGIAPGASLVNLKALDANGNGSDSSVIAAIDHAIDIKDQFGIRVMNLSIGRQVFESYQFDPLCIAAEAAWKAGITVVVAAGNDGRETDFGVNGYATITAPGNDPYVITVGAMKAENTYTRTDDLIASYSSKGPTPIDHIVKPDVLAPGNQVISLLAPGSALLAQYPANQVPLSTYISGLSATQGAQFSSAYFLLNGTSMATAVVSGSAADLLQAYPKLTPDEVKLLLMKTATKNFPTSSTVTDPTTSAIYTDYYDLFTVGAGYIDLQAALQAGGGTRMKGSADSPVAVHDPKSGTVEIAFDPESVWAKHADLAQTVWGTSVLTGTTVLWGGDAPWGNASSLRGMPNGASAVWCPFSIWLLDAVTNGAAGQQGIWSQGGVQGQQGVWSQGGVQGQQGVWSQGGIQGQQGVWSQGGIQGQQGVWSQGSVQGQQGVWSQGSVQGQQGVWSQGTVQSQQSVWGAATPGSLISNWSAFTTVSDAVSIAGEN